MKLKILAVWLLLCVIWSSTWIFIKLGLRDLPPFGFAGVRFLIASSALALINLARGAHWPTARRDWALIALTGFLMFGVNYGALFWGEQRISSGLCAVLQATIPAFGLLFAHFYVPGERLTPMKIGGVALGLVGVAVIFSDEMHLGLNALAGSASVVCGAAAAAYGSVLIKARGGHLDPAVLSASQMIFGWVPLLLVGGATEGAPWRFHWTGQAVFALFYLALMGSSLAFCMMYWLTKRAEITRVMLISLVTPVAAVVIGAIVLNEKLAPRALLGGACVLAGLFLVIYRRSASAMEPIVPAAETMEGAEG